MKVCIPVKKNEGLESIAFNHFGSAPFFLIYDSELEKTSLIENENMHHEHGKCQPLKALRGENVDAVLVRGIGAGALTKLHHQGVKVYQALEESVSKNIERLSKNELSEFTSTHTCSHHGHNH